MAIRPIGKTLLGSCSHICRRGTDGQLPALVHRCRQGPWRHRKRGGGRSRVRGIAALSSSLTWIRRCSLVRGDRCRRAIHAGVGTGCRDGGGTGRGSRAFRGMPDHRCGQTPTAPADYLLTTMLAVFALGPFDLARCDRATSWNSCPFSAWPWVTGSLQLAAGFASISVKLVRTVFPLVAAMFLAWMPLVHGEDLADPSTGVGGRGNGGGASRMPDPGASPCSVAADALATPRAQRDKAPTMPPRPAM